MSATTRSMPLERTIGLTGIAGTVLLFTALIIGSPGEPPTDASTAAAAEFVKGLDRSWLPPVEAVADIGMMVLLWFMVGLPLLLRRYEGATPVRSTVAIVSGALVAAFVVLDSAQEAGAHRSADLDQGQLAYAYDLTAVGFTNVWLPMGCFAFACGWIVVATNAMPRWLGWWGVIAGIALSFAQFVWRAGEFWLLPYVPFWLWLLTTCVVLVRRPAMARIQARAV
ncbi:uncharacterized protein DUF4386 [Kribbella sp. VKM Ac-2527]|uniref:Uncharacterized protein DUF4386 n=1 Tax=Kribbella caucasensis TaxID=2512215 RepID=A0A4R6KD95_9ACTN|nr:DUF4386 family protein [Kribbella sp. VKM Ac-2527]TDO45815.1 uncharacterized protein DUF4386 [Kribbella sp. VKM Ac-2527]